MKITCEASIDLDANRKIWITGVADDVPEEHAGKLGSELVQATTANACAALGQATERLGIEPIDPGAEIARAAGASPLPASERRKHPGDPESMRAFGEDEGDDPLTS